MESLKSFIPQKKQEAKKLYVQTSLTAKEIGLQIGVTEKSIGKWVKEYGWKVQREIRIAKELGLKDVGKLGKQQVITDLKKHLKSLNPSLFNQVEPLIDNFLQLK